jgi:signal transduction histidine kinase
MAIHKLVPLFALALNVLLLGAVLGRDRKPLHAQLFGYVVLSLSLWNVGVLGLRWAETPDVASRWEHLVHLGVIPIPVLFYHYVLAFLRRSPFRSPFRPSLVVAYAATALFLGASATHLFMSGVRPSPWGYVPVAGPVYAAFVVYFQSYLILGLARLLRDTRRNASSFTRNRARLVVFGGAISVLGGVVDFVRFMFGLEALYPVGIPCNSLFAAALGVAIVRFRLFDIGILAKRVVLYGLTAAAFAPVVFFTVTAIDTLPITAQFTIVFGAFVITFPLLAKLQRACDGFIMRRQHGVRDALLSLSKEMASLLDVHRLGDTLTRALVANIPVSHATLHLYDAATGASMPMSQAVSPDTDGSAPEMDLEPVVALWLRVTCKTLVVDQISFQSIVDRRLRAALAELETAGVALMVPLLLDGELAAVLMLGEKVSREVFTSSEIELIEMLMAHTAIALKNSRLYQSVHEQMAELQRTQQQLVQSAKLAAIGELAAGVAHEINNPLTVVLGYAELLLRDVPEGSRDHGRLSKIRNETTRASRIMQDLLSFARRREPKREALDVHDVLRRVMELLNAKLTTARVEPELIFDPDVPAIIGDADQLAQVFLNLVGNAADAMPDGGVVTVETMTMTWDGQPCVAIRVKDRGVGMTPEQLEKIFEPFYTTKPEGQGTGLGLPISLGIVRKHGGSLTVESEPRKGTSMIVTLPVDGAAMM